MSISVNEIRKDFPLLENQKVIYLDTAATSQKPVCVLEAEREFYEKYNANPLRGLYELGEAATDKSDETRQTDRGSRDGPGVFKCQRGGGDRFRPQCHGRFKPGGVQFRLPGTETGR